MSRRLRRIYNIVYIYKCIGTEPIRSPVVAGWSLGVVGCVGRRCVGKVARRDALLTFGSSLTTLRPFFDIIRTPMGIMLILVAASGFVSRRNRAWKTLFYAR